MTFIKNIQQYLAKSNLDIAFAIAVLGILCSSFIEHAWIICILACYFIKEDNR